ncbi:MAG: HEAT repeat domain-containing protein [Verrucomicrobiales bacterium]|nr:HEAT repeat domain-containing protein [Verrucomicrobiales bacterium]
MHIRSARVPGLQFLALLAFLTALSAKSEELFCAHCMRNAWLATTDAKGGRQYAPSREIDIKHLILDVIPDFNRSSIEGTATLRWSPIAKPLTQLRLDAVDLRVQSVTSSEPIQAWQSTDTQIEITFSSPVAADKAAEVVIRYSATPRRGLYFRTPAEGYPAADSHLWTQGEPTEARHWFPSFDAPNEKFTSEVICHVPSDMVALSNGKQLSSELDANTGLRSFRWLQDKPHVNYLIALAAGHLKGIEEKYRDIPLALYTPASQIANARNTLAGTSDMMAFFEKEIGVAYPWDKYYQVAVADYHWGGMENTTLTILNDATLYPDGFETLRSSESLVAHELAHQWFGDLVTCKDWSHLWLNEGFATYYDALYRGSKHGPDELLYIMYQSAKGIVAVPDDRLPIVHRGFSSPEEQFSFRAYPKGSWILHMLRHQLGEDLYRKCVQTYVERHKFGVVETEDLVRVIEELSGRSFDAFFDQYVYHAQQPDLRITYEWLEKEKLAKVSVTQNQPTSPEVLLFQIPVKFRFGGKAGTVDREWTLKDKSAEFYAALSEKPDWVRFDPEFSVLAKVSFDLPFPLVAAQLANGSDLIGRLEAIAQLARKKDSASVELLKKVLLNDSFYGARIEASKALRQIDTPDARLALQSGLAQGDARVRAQVLNDVTRPYREESLGQALRTLGQEKNPDILASAIRSLGSYSRPQTRDFLLAFLATNSYRAVLSDAAVVAMRQQADPSYIPPLLAAVTSNQTSWPTASVGAALEALASLGRLQEAKAEVRDYLSTFLDAPQDRLQMAAIRALGQLGDPAALPALEKFIDLPKTSRVRQTADAALTELRTQRKPGVDLGDVRDQVLSLQQENKDLKRDLETLKKKVEALAAPADSPSSTNAASKPKSAPRSRPPVPTR